MEISSLKPSLSPNSQANEKIKAFGPKDTTKLCIIKKVVDYK